MKYFNLPDSTIITLSPKPFAQGGEGDLAQVIDESYHVFYINKLGVCVKDCP